MLLQRRLITSLPTRAYAVTSLDLVNDYRSISEAHTTLVVGGSRGVGFSLVKKALKRTRGPVVATRRTAISDEDSELG